MANKFNKTSFLPEILYKTDQNYLLRTDLIFPQTIGWNHIWHHVFIFTKFLWILVLGKSRLIQNRIPSFSMYCLKPCEIRVTQFVHKIKVNCYKKERLKHFFIRIPIWYCPNYSVIPIIRLSTSVSKKSEKFDICPAPIMFRIFGYWYQKFSWS